MKAAVSRIPGFFAIRGSGDAFEGEHSDFGNNIFAIYSARPLNFGRYILRDVLLPRGLVQLAGCG